MRVLIVEDDFISRRILQKFLSEHGDCDIAVDGREAYDAFMMAWQESRPYDLICMDIMMPNIDGFQALKNVRETEKEMEIKERDGVKVIMTTALDDPKSVFKAFDGGAASYLVKPVTKQKLIEEVRSLGLLVKLPCGR